MTAFALAGCGAGEHAPDRIATHVRVRRAPQAVHHRKTPETVDVYRADTASPNMGGVSPDERTLRLSGRYNSVVYAINTHTGRLHATIPVGNGPHGLCFWPQPGRFAASYRHPALGSRVA